MGFKPAMKENIMRLLRSPEGRVNIKARTHEKVIRANLVNRQLLNEADFSSWSSHAGWQHWREPFLCMPCCSPTWKNITFSRNFTISFFLYALCSRHREIVCSEFPIAYNRRNERPHLDQTWFLSDLLVAYTHQIMMSPTCLMFDWCRTDIIWLH